MSEVIHSVILRNKEYFVHVKDTISPMTTLWFIYNKTKLEDSVYLPGDIDSQDLNRILTIKVRDNIRKYNKRRQLNKVQK